jgi:hypothetical protein
MTDSTSDPHPLEAALRAEAQKLAQELAAALNKATIAEYSMLDAQSEQSRLSDALSKSQELNAALLDEKRIAEQHWSAREEELYQKWSTERVLRAAETAELKTALSRAELLLSSEFTSIPDESDQQPENPPQRAASLYCVDRNVGTTPDLQKETDHAAALERAAECEAQLVVIHKELNALYVKVADGVAELAHIDCLYRRALADIRDRDQEITELRSRIKKMVLAQQQQQTRTGGLEQDVAKLENLLLTLQMQEQRRDLLGSEERTTQTDDVREAISHDAGLPPLSPSPMRDGIIGQRTTGRSTSNVHQSSLHRSGDKDFMVSHVIVSAESSPHALQEPLSGALHEDLSPPPAAAPREVALNGGEGPSVTDMIIEEGFQVGEDDDDEACHKEDDDAFEVVEVASNSPQSTRASANVTPAENVQLIVDAARSSSKSVTFKLPTGDEGLNFVCHAEERQSSHSRVSGSSATLLGASTSTQPQLAAKLLEKTSAVSSPYKPILKRDPSVGPAAAPPIVQHDPCSYEEQLSQAPNNIGKEPARRRPDRNGCLSEDHVTANGGSGTKQAAERGKVPSSRGCCF